MVASSFAIHPAPSVAPENVLAAFREVATPHISDNLQRLSGVVGLHRFHRHRKLVGTAITVKTRPGDNLLIYKALMMASPGHVLVIDGGGDTNNALVGELIMLYAQQRGCTGIVLDGAIRDAAAFREADFPCYARAAIHRGPYKNGPGAVNVPVSVGGQIVQPGDIVVGDDDGIVTFPPTEAARVLDAIEQTARFEAAIKAEIANGKVEQSWLTKAFAPHGL
ncbi:RraA family protein [Variovorax boronicumulans]|uniref:RraA family protein n=1 Tax=Variovorax boronicumulans TaxID=436515 RepID=UPI0027854078|nr:RraA family protein [Variovorax boronicumulans]MDP9994007.1 RraA family protein [Variovorax boronicumulans]MDQ0005130.1 RraA family protein [Variovorax boronicumulans]